MTESLSSSNQSIDMHSRLMDWFLYDRDLRHKRVKIDEQFIFYFFEILNPFQPSIAFHIETSHFISTTNQITGFFNKCNNVLKWVNDIISQKNDNIRKKVVGGTQNSCSWRFGKCLEMTSAIVANECEESQFKLGAQEGLETQPCHEISGNFRVDEIVTFSDVFRG